MAKKTVSEQFREWSKAAHAESNKPMTRGEIAKAEEKKNRTAASKKRSMKPSAKKNSKKASKKAVKKKKKAERRS